MAIAVAAGAACERARSVPGAVACAVRTAQRGDLISRREGWIRTSPTTSFQSKEPARVGHRQRGNVHGWLIAQFGNALADAGQKGRLIAARPGRIRQRAWQQVGRIGFEQQPIGRDAWHQLGQVVAAALVADPAGDADVAVIGLVRVEVGGGTREAVHDDARQAGTVLTEDAGDAAMRIAIVDEHRHPQVNGEFQLLAEYRFLGGGWRKVAMEVEAGLANRDDASLSTECGEALAPTRFDTGGSMRMHAGGGAQKVGVAVGHCQRLRRGVGIGAGDDDVPEAGLARAFQHLIDVTCECGIGEIGADVDQQAVCGMGGGAIMDRRAVVWTAATNRNQYKRTRSARGAIDRVLLPK